MNQKPHPGPHPDADRLSIFAEGIGTATERERMLAHLAECQECRDVVFLMQRQVETAYAAKEPAREWVWQKWFLPVGFAGAALAGLAALMLYVHPWRRSTEAVRQNVALVESGARAQGIVVAPSSGATPPAKPEETKNGSAPATGALSHAREDAGTTADSKTQSVGSLPTSANGANQEMEASTPSISVSARAHAGAALKSDARAEINSDVIQELPLKGRNVASLQPLAPPPPVPTATPRDTSAKQQNLTQLLVERPSGPDETLSGVSGRVTDPTGAVVPGADVALRDASGDTRQTATDANGSFRLTGIPAGHYDLTVTSPGFRSSQQPIDVKPRELAMVQSVLTVGAVSQTVEVTATAAPLQTESASAISFPAELPSHLPSTSSVSLGKRVLSLDRAGSVFLSGNQGKTWKKVHPQWTGKAVRIDLAAGQPGKAKANDKTEAVGAESAQKIFQLTNDSGAQWSSKDGTHWRPQ